MDLETLIDELRKKLGVDEVDLDDSSATLLLNNSIAEIESNFPFHEKDSRVDFDTIAGSPKYTLVSDFESVVTVSVLDENDNKSVLARMTKTDYEEQYSASEEAEGIPTHYIRDSGCIILWPTPDDEYRVTIRYNKTLAELVAMGNEPNMPRNWHEIVLYGATWRGFIDLGDYNRADRVKNHQVALIKSTVPVESKEEFDTHTGGVKVYNGNDSGKRWSR